MSNIVITDVTHFKNEQLICVAGIDIDAGECVRPVTPDYLTTVCRKELNIMPGAILSGRFQFWNNNKPHIEDARYENLKFERFCSNDEFRKILENSLSENIEDGFSVQLSVNQKHVPVSDNPIQSLITISINPKSICIFQDAGFGKKRIKAHFIDKSGKEYRFIPVNDLGYYEKEYDFDKVNFVTRSQQEVFLRIGLGRFYKNPYDDRAGYWIQVNGIYSFPDYFKDARVYS